MHLKALPLLLLLFLLAACQSARAPESDKMLATILSRRSQITRVAFQTPSPTSIVLERPTPTIALPPTAQPAGKAWQWQQVGEVPNLYASDVYYDGSQLIWTEKVWRSKTAATYMQYIRAGETKQVLREAPASWKISSARLAGGQLAMVETSADQPVRVLLFNLSTGEMLVIGARDGQFASPKHPPNLALDDTYLAWNSYKPDGRTCLRLYDLRAGSFADLFCTERASDTLEIIDLRWPVVTYWRTIENQDASYRSPGVYSQIGALENFRCDGSQPVSSGLVLGCLSKMPDKDSLIPYTQTQPAGGSTADSPLAFDETLQVCDGRAFWLPDRTQVHSWQPGRSEEVIYSTLDSTEQIQDIRCTGGWITALVYNSASPDKRLAVWAAPIPE